MKKTAKKELPEGAIVIKPVQQETRRFFVLGRSPLILNRMSQKAKWELLAPKKKEKKSEQEARPKHNPIAEFRAAAYTLPDGPNLLALPATAFKKAIATAALDLPGATRSQIGRLVYVVGEYVGIYGVPRLHMSVTRSADAKKTPDIRTRCIVPEWAAIVEVKFVSSIINEVSLTNLFNASGVTAGVGDWRTEKGSGNYGQFCLVNEDHPDFHRIVKTGGRVPQIEALERPDPIPYDTDSADLLAYHNEQMKLRGFKVAA